MGDVAVCSFMLCFLVPHVHALEGACKGALRIQVFFCKYNDPIYVKMEKLDIMILLANDRNIDQVLLEFKEYATEVDVDFVRRVKGLSEIPLPSSSTGS